MTVFLDIEITKDRFPDLHRVNWTPVYGIMGSYMTREWDTMFETVGVSRRHKWQELATSTLITKAKRGWSTEILQRTGHLRASGRVLSVTEDGLFFGTDDPKAKYHDSDRPREQKKSGGPRLPQRKLLKFNAADAKFFEERLLGFVDSVAAGEKEGGFL